MKKFLILIAAIIATSIEVSFAQTSTSGNVTVIDTRPNVTMSYYAVWRDDAVATLVFFTGGGGGFGRLSSKENWPVSNNFLIRTAPQFASYPFNVVLLGKASDIPTLDWHVRVGAEHLQDNLAALRSIRKRNAAPIWLVGTSRGTVSATATTIADIEGFVNGLVLTSSVTDYGRLGAVPTQDLSRIRVPTLVVHHQNDACKACPPHGVGAVMRGLVNAPLKKQEMVSGGESLAEGEPCEALGMHGFRGIESIVIDKIALWIMQSVPAN